MTAAALAGPILGALRALGSRWFGDDPLAIVTQTACGYGPGAYGDGGDCPEEQAVRCTRRLGAMLRNRPGPAEPAPAVRLMPV